MALGLVSEGGGGGNIVPIIKFDAKAGDFIRQDRAQNASGEWEKSNHEMALPLSVLMDFDTLEVGWLSFASGAPDFQMVKVGEQMPARPTDEHKQAFRVRLFGKDMGLREFSSQAKTVIRQFDSLHNQYEAERANHPGEVPQVTISGTKTVTVNTPQGENRFKVPEWSITGWFDRSKMDTATAVSAPAPESVAPSQNEASNLF